MAHYALSELLIVLAALWAGTRLVAHDRAIAALGVLLFGAAAAIGAVRFSFGLIEPWADMHRFAGTMGGLLAMMALTHQVVRFETARLSPQSHMALAALGLGLALAMPALRVPLFLIWSLGFIWLAARHTPLRLSPAWQKAGVAGFMLFNVLVFRQSPYLDAALSWHIFHVLVALWIVGVVWLFSPSVPD
ncbi:MAG: hypothetical protein HOK33_08210 [Rhodobiaceae bacterium]|jgi:hypothetical protein|nr:hypothetical protein [Rhodobiaceae bacterium]MBT5518907.1 hypothetical protein [Rhodobiaceae bacterium]MBT7279241.1 hypothetical protein [Rhodobiaceae bacterium]